MAQHKSAIKEHRQSRDRRLRNRWNRARLRTTIKIFRAALTEGDAEKARGMLPETLSLVDRVAKLGAIHTNAASRTKSRLTVAVNKLAS